jgi:hypothetical protein
MRYRLVLEFEDTDGQLEGMTEAEAAQEFQEMMNEEFTEPGDPEMKIVSYDLYVAQDRG